MERDLLTHRSEVAALVLQFEGDGRFQLIGDRQADDSRAGQDHCRQDERGVHPQMGNSELGTAGSQHRQRQNGWTSPVI